MSITQFLPQLAKWLAWAGIVLSFLTLISFLFKWGFRFRLVGATIFTFLVSGSCLAFEQSYLPPKIIEGAVYAPIVYDNGRDIVIAQAENDFPETAIIPTLEQIAQNLKGGGRNGALVDIRLRKLEKVGDGISKPVILGKVLRDTMNSKTIFVEEIPANSEELTFLKEIPTDIEETTFLEEIPTDIEETTFLDKTTSDPNQTIILEGNLN